MTKPIKYKSVGADFHKKWFGRGYELLCLS